MRLICCFNFWVASRSKKKKFLGCVNREPVNVHHRIKHSSIPASLPDRADKSFSHTSPKQKRDSMAAGLEDRSGELK